MSDDGSREGWTPEIGRDASLAEVVDAAFDYRGNVSIRCRDGRSLEGYVFNRNGAVREPFLQLFDLAGMGPITVLYRDVEAIHFTGHDTAAGKSYAAWLERRAREKGERATIAPTS